jgi:IMP dehydrogenase/GMP reductase
MPVIRHGLAYNDVLLVPRYSRVRSRNEVDLSTVIAPGMSLAVQLSGAGYQESQAHDVLVRA